MFKNFIYAFIIIYILISITQFELSGEEAVINNIELNNVITKYLNSANEISSSGLQVIVEAILLNTDIQKSGKIIGFKSPNKSKVIKNMNLNSLIPALLYNSVAFDSKAKEDLYASIKRLNEEVFEQFNIKPDLRYYDPKNTMISPDRMPAVSIIYEIPYSTAGDPQTAIIAFSFILEYDMRALCIQLERKNSSNFYHENSGYAFSITRYVLCEHKAKIMKHLFKKYGIY